jgi:hypothetical protein
MADIGIWMQPTVLAHKLEERRTTRPIQAWNLARWPAQLSEPGEHRLFVANRDAWQGFFRLEPDALYNPRDSRAPFTLLFDARSWTPIEPSPRKRFRGFTYDVPRIGDSRDSEETSQP